VSEDLVRDVFASREHLVDGSQVGLADAVRQRVARRRRVGWVAAGGLTLVTALGVTAAALTVARPDGTASLQAPPAAATNGPAWRWESSLGAEIEVPAHWAVNDYGCNMTDQPTVVRGLTGGRACLTPEPSTKELAILQSGPPESTPHDGRYAGWRASPSGDVYLIVRTLDRDRTQRILDSFRLVDPDRLGCPTHRPAVRPQQPDLGGGFVQPDAASIAVCSYYVSSDGRLQASAEVTGDDVGPIVAGMNAAPRHRNPPTDACIETRTPAPDLVLLVRGPRDQLTRVWVTFSYCTGRGLDNGTGQAYLTDVVLHQLMRPLKTTYGWPGGPGKPTD